MDNLVGRASGGTWYMNMSNDDEYEIVSVDGPRATYVALVHGGIEVEEQVANLVLLSYAPEMFELLNIRASEGDADAQSILTRMAEAYVVELSHRSHQ